MKVLLDENPDHALRRLPGAHDVVTASYMGWTGLKNGDLLREAEASGIDVLLTGDQTLGHEQNLAGRRLGIVALSAIELPIIRENVGAIVAANRYGWRRLSGSQSSAPEIRSIIQNEQSAHSRLAVPRNAGSGRAEARLRSRSSAPHNVGLILVPRDALYSRVPEPHEIV